MSNRVVWSSEAVKLFCPSSEQYRDVIHRLKADSKTIWRLDVYNTQLSGSICLINSVHNIASLGLFKCIVDPRSFSDTLSSNITITTIWLDYTPLTLTGVQQLYRALAGNKTLQTLWLTHDRTVNDRTVLYIAQILSINRSLQQLSLFGCDVGDDGTSTLMESLRVNTSLTSLNIAGNRRVTSSSSTSLCQMIKSNSSLMELHLFDTSLTEGAIHQICKCLQWSMTCKRRISISEVHKKACSDLPFYDKIKYNLVFV